MDLNAARIFVKVVQSGGFSAAARLLKMPVSTVSTKVSQLERHLGSSLLVRTTRKLQLTDIGSRFYQHALNACNELQAAEASTHEEQEEVSGLIRLTGPIEMGATSLTDVIASFLKKYPKTQFELLLTDRIVDLVGEGLDLALRVGEMTDSSLMAKKIGFTGLQIYASPSYLKKFDEPKKPKDLEEHHCLNFEGFEDGIWHLKAMGKSAVKVRVKGAVSSNNLNSLHRLAVSGVGIILLPSFLCVEDVSQGRLKQILKDYNADQLPIYLVYPNQKFIPKRVRVFMDFVSENLKDFF